jgi:hypothetical protein
MENKSLEDEIKTILASAHDRGAEALAGEAPTLTDLDPADPSTPFVATATVVTERIWAFLAPVIQGIEEAIARVARELDNHGNA